MKSPLVSVIIATYNRASFVVEALESVLAQTYLPIEIVLVNDGSCDDTETALAPYMSRIRYVYQANGGLASARNRGIRESRGEFLAFLDDDDKWMPEKLQLQVNRLTRYPEVGLVHTELLRWNYRNGRFEHKPGIRHEYVGKCFDRLFFHGNSMMPSTVMLRRECVERVGLFAEEFRHVADDYEYFLRVSKHFDVAFISEPLVYYRLHENNLSKNTLATVECDLRVVEGALRSDGSLWRTLGKRRVSERLYNLCLWAGYLHLEENRFDVARSYFTRAAKYQPANFRIWALSLVLMLPKERLLAMKSLKKHLTEPVPSAN